MSTATFSRVHNWATEILQFADLNTEVNNILNNLNPLGVGAYSDTVGQMQKITNPGATGSESLATSLAGELERLRYSIKRMGGTGLTNWYDPPPTSLSSLVSSLGSALPNNYIVSGLTTGNSSQLAAFVPTGTADSVVLSVGNTSVPFTYFINAVQYSITSNVTVSSLTLAPTSNATAVVLDPVMSGQQWTQFLGQYGTQILVNSTAANIGSNVSNLAGQIAGYSVGNEYFIGKYNSTVGSIQNALRGGFITAGSTQAPAVTVGNNAVITLNKLTWLYATTAASVAVGYTNPTIAAAQPSSPAIGDYWFNLNQTANQWYTYNGTSWLPAGATLVGMCMQNTVNCVAARTFDPAKSYSDLSSLNLTYLSGTQIGANDRGAQVNVFGTTIGFDQTQPIWDITQNLDTGTVTSGTNYYFYLKENGAPWISQQVPTYRRGARGLYHPSEAYRCVAQAMTNTASAVTVPIRSFRAVPNDQLFMGDLLAYSFNTANNLRVSPANAYFVLPQNLRQATANANYIGGNYTAPGGNWQSITAVSLDPGVWELNAFGGTCLIATNISRYSVGLGIGLSSDSSFTAGVTGFNAVSFQNTSIYLVGGTASNSTVTTTLNSNCVVNIDNTYSSLVVPPVRVCVSTPATNYSLFAFFTNTGGGNASFLGSIATLTARRLDSQESSPV